MSRERNYTKGPWYFDMAVDAYNKGKETFAIYSHPNPGHTVEIIETPDIHGRDCVHGRDVTEKMANANLIAAAPELLQACENVLADLAVKMNGEDTSDCSSPEETFAYLEAAIKKAYGETE